MRVRRGEVWTVTLDPTVANEQAGTRPCIVVSTDRFNALPIRQSIVVPLTTRDRGLPHHLPLSGSGLDRPSWVMCEAVRAVSLARFKRYIGTADDTTTDAVSQQIVRWLGMTGTSPA